MRYLRTLAFATLLPVTLSSCNNNSKEAASTDAAAENSVPERVMEGYPVQIANAISYHGQELSEAAKNVQTGFSVSHVILQTRAWGRGSTVTVAFHGGNSNLYQQIEAAAQEWTKPGLARVTFSFRDANGNYRQWNSSDASSFRLPCVTRSSGEPRFSQT